MKRNWNQCFRRTLAACGLALTGTSLAFGQAAPQPRPAAPPPGVISEQADDAAVRGGGTQPLVVGGTGTTTAAPTNAGLNGGAAASAAITADNTHAADLGLWLNQTGGALTISDLATTGPIAGLGLMPGDKIVSVNGQPVQAERDFVRHILADGVRNQQVNLVVARNGVNQTVQVQPSALVQGMVSADPLHQAGLVIDSSNPSQLRVQRVYPRTPAYYAGVRAGDVITNVGGQPVTSAQALQSAWTYGNNGLPVQISRAGQSRGLTFNSTAGMFGQPLNAQGQQRGTLIDGAAGATINAPGANVSGTGAAGVATGNPTTRGGSLFPNAIVPPVASVPGSTQRVPVTIPGATTPAAGNPSASAPGAPVAGNPSALPVVPVAGNPSAGAPGAPVAGNPSAGPGETIPAGTGAPGTGTTPGAGAPGAGGAAPGGGAAGGSGAK